MSKLVLFAIVFIYSLTCIPEQTKGQQGLLIPIRQIGKGSIKNISWGSDSNLSIASTKGTWIYSNQAEIKLLSADTYQTLWYQAENRLITSDKLQLTVWDTSTSDISILRQYPINSPLSISWSPDGSMFATSAVDVLIYSLTSTEPLMVLSDPDKRSNGLIDTDWKPDGSEVSSLSSGGVFQVWDVKTGERIVRELSINGSDLGLNAAWSPDGSSYVVATANSGIWLWDTTTWENNQIIPFNASGLIQVEWANNSELIIGINNEVIKYNLQTQEQTVIARHIGAIRQIAIDRQTRQIASVGDEQYLIVTDMTTHHQIKKISDFSKGITHVAWSPDSQLVMSEATDHSQEVWASGYLRIWDISLNSIVFENNFNKVNWANWQPDSQMLAIGDTTGMVRLVDPLNNSVTQTIQLFTNPVSVLTWNPQGTQIIASSYHGELSLWDSKTNSIEVQDTDKVERSLQWSPQGDRIIRVYRNTVEVLDTTSWQILEAFEEKNQDLYIVTAIWNPDGTAIAIMRGDGAILVWDTQTQNIKFTISSGAKPLYIPSILWEGLTPILWSPDGEYILASYISQKINVWDAQTGEHLETLEGHSDQVTTLAWSPDGQTLASGSLDGTIILWHLDQMMLRTGGLVVK